MHNKPDASAILNASTMQAEDAALEGIAQGNAAQGDAVTHTRSPYSTPQLTHYGKLERLTLQVGGASMPLNCTDPTDPTTCS